MSSSHDTATSPLATPPPPGAGAATSSPPAEPGTGGRSVLTPPSPGLPFGAGAWAAIFVGLAGILLLFSQLPGKDKFTGIGLLLAAGFGTLMVLSGPIVALGIYFITTFFGGQQIPGIPISINQIVGSMTLLTWVTWGAFGRLQMPPKGWFLKLVFIACAYYLVNCALGEGEKFKMTYLRGTILLGLMCLILVTSLKSPEHWRLWFWLVIGTTCMTASVGIYEFISGMDLLPFANVYQGYLAFNRINGVSQNAIMYAFNNLWTVPLALWLVLEGRSTFQRMIAAVVVMFLIILSLMTLNRQTPITLGVMLFTFFSLAYHPAIRRIFVAFLIAVVFALPFVAHNLVKRYTRVAESAFRDPSFTYRYDKMITCINIVAHKPIFGIGFGSFPDKYENYLPPGRTKYIHFFKAKDFYPDMCYAQMLAETGIVGFTLMLALIGIALQRLLHTRKAALAIHYRPMANLCTVLIMMFVQLLTSMLFQDLFMNNRSWFLLAMAALVTSRPFGEIVKPQPGWDPQADDEKLARQLGGRYVVRLLEERAKAAAEPASAEGR